MAMTKRKKKIIIISTAVIFLIIIGIIVFLVVNDNGFEYENLETVKDTARLPDKEYPNLKFADNIAINLPESDKLYEYEMDNSFELISYDEASENCLIFGDYFFDNVFDGHVPVKDIHRHDCSVEVTVGDEFYTARYYTQNMFLIYKQSTVDTVFYSELVDNIYLDRGEQATDKMYKLRGQDYSPKQALDLAQKTMDEFVSKQLEDYDFRATNIIILYNKEENNYCYRVQFERMLDGAPANDADILAMGDDLSFMMNYTTLYMTITEPDVIGEIYHMNPFVVTDKKKLYDRYVTLESAIENLSEYLAEYNVQDIKEISVKYANKMMKNEPNKLRPYWCFVMELPYDPKLYCMTENIIYVDMKTGEIITCSPSDMRYHSSLE